MAIRVRLLAPGPISINISAMSTNATLLAAFTGTGKVIVGLDGYVSFYSNEFATSGNLSGRVVYTYTPAAVPEPGSAILLATGIAALVLFGSTDLARRRA